MKWEQSIQTSFSKEAKAKLNMVLTTVCQQDLGKEDQRALKSKTQCKEDILLSNGGKMLWPNLRRSEKRRL